MVQLQCFFNSDYLRVLSYFFTKVCLFNLNYFCVIGTINRKPHCELNNLCAFTYLGQRFGTSESTKGGKDQD